MIRLAVGPCQYQLVIRVPIDALDDPMARQKVDGILANTKEHFPKDTTIKFQRVFDNKPPESMG